MAPEEKTVTLTKIEAPMKSSSGPWKAAVSVSFWREMCPWPSEICSRGRREERRWFLGKWGMVEGREVGEGERGEKRWGRRDSTGVSLSHLHPLQGALDGDPTGVLLHPEDGQSMSIHQLVEYIPGGWTAISLALKHPHNLMCLQTQPQVSACRHNFMCLQTQPVGPRGAGGKAITFGKGRGGPW